METLKFILYSIELYNIKRFFFIFVELTQIFLGKKIAHSYQISSNEKTIAREETFYYRLRLFRDVVDSILLQLDQRYGITLLDRLDNPCHRRGSKVKV